MLVIEQTQEFITHLSKINNKDIKENLIELQWFEFRKFLYEAGKDRFSMSDYLKLLLKLKETCKNYKVRVT